MAILFYRSHVAPYRIAKAISCSTRSTGRTKPERSPLFHEENNPPAFLACGNQDRQNISEGLATRYLDMKKAGINTEPHIYASVGHGFGLRPSWPSARRLRELFSLGSDEQAVEVEFEHGVALFGELVAVAGIFRVETVLDLPLVGNAIAV